MINLRHILVLLLLLCSGQVLSIEPVVPAVTPVSAPPDVHNYDDIAREVFWSQLYAGGGWSLYCGYRFDMEGRSPDGYAVGIDQIYATEWMLDHLQCQNRPECYAKNNQFRKMEADMHNLYPAWSDLIVYRNGRSFGNVAGKESRFDECEFEWNSDVVEPRDLSNGNVARSIFYMHRQYKLPVSNELMKVLKAWNRQDLPSEQERVRNDTIEKIQGQRNPYIDNPGLADRLGTGQKK